MLTRITDASCPQDPTSYAYRCMHSEVIVDRYISAQENFHMLENFALVTCSRSFIKLNVGRHMFHRISHDSIDCLSGSSFIDSYLQHPPNLDHFYLIGLAQQWSYNHACKREEWKKRNVPAIVHVYPHFTSIPAKYSNAFLDFCWSEFLLYNPFHSFTKDIGLPSHVIFSNWENIRNTYNFP